MTDQDLSTVVSELKKAHQYHAAAWEHVIREARKCAQMRALGTYIENGMLIHVNHGERERYVEMFESGLRFAIDSAFNEDLQLGIAVSNALGKK